MRRLALLAAAVLAVAAAPAARAEPLDVDLTRLGAPDPQVWTALGMSGFAAARRARRGAREGGPPAVRDPLVRARDRALVGDPPPRLHHRPLRLRVRPRGRLRCRSTRTPSGARPPSTRDQPGRPSRCSRTQLFMPSFHVRKALPWSASSWAAGSSTWPSSNATPRRSRRSGRINEGFDYVPDVAVRGAYTRSSAPRDWNLAPRPTSTSWSRSGGASTA